MTSTTPTPDVPEVPDAPEAEGRVARRQRRNREALIRAACTVMTEKGIDAATMLEIAELADVGAGTVYNYFKSKDELAVAVLEEMMHALALRIEAATVTIADPAQIFVFGMTTVLDAATTDISWRQMLYRSEVIADALYRRMGPFAIRDCRNAVAAGRFRTSDSPLVWRLCSHGIVGAGLAIQHGQLPAEAKVDVIARLVCMTGVDEDDAKALALGARKRIDEGGAA